MLLQNYFNYSEERLHRPFEAFGVEFADLYSLDGLLKIDDKFREFLYKKNPEIANNFFSLKKYDAAILLEVAKVLEDFLVELFDVEEENNILKKHHAALEKIYYVRREFVQRFVAKKFNVAFGGDGLSLLKALNIDFVDIDDLEKKLAKKIFLLLESDVDNKLYKLDFDGMNMWTEVQNPSTAN